MIGIYRHVWRERFSRRRVFIPSALPVVLASSTGSSDGTSTVSGVGLAALVQAGEGSSIGSSTVDGVSGILFGASGDAQGSAATTGAGGSLAGATGSASGSSTVDGAGPAAIGPVGATGDSAGVATTTGVGGAIVSSTGTASGSSTISGLGADGVVAPYTPVRVVESPKAYRAVVFQGENPSTVGQYLPPEYGFRSVNGKYVIDKDPSAKLDYIWDFTNLVELNDPLVEHLVGATGGLVVESSTMANNVVTVWLLGGSKGLWNPSSCTVRFTTLQGRVDERTLYFQIVEK